MTIVGLRAGTTRARLRWSGYGVVATFVLGSASARSRSTAPIARHTLVPTGAAIVLTFMMCAMHATPDGDASAVPDPAPAVAPYLMPGRMLGLALVGAVFLVIGSGFSSYVIDLRVRTSRPTVSISCPSTTP